MTLLQNKELELLKIFLKIADELQLNYYLVCGSALGAVKYKGFIPWDDDIDVALPRKDYEIFINNSRDLLPEWCFLQNYRTDRYFIKLGSKLRDTRTTYIESMCGCLPINHGVFIDIFPLDGYYSDDRSQKMYNKIFKEFEGKRRVNLQYNRFSPTYILQIQTNFYYIMNKLFKMYDDTSKIISKYDKLVSSFPLEKSDLWCNYANSSSTNEYAPRSQYGEGAWAEFEGLKVRVPEKYDEYLTQKYGDWRAELPKDQQVGHHFYEICDLNRPYTDYLESLPKGKVRIKNTK